jgi:starch synthase
VGGLAETVRDVDADPKAGNGFSFGRYAVEPFADAIQRAMNRFHADGAPWRELVGRAMREDHSWNASAKRYADLYRKAVRSRHAS